MRFGKIKWLAWVLVVMMLFASVQVSAAGTYRVAQRDAVGVFKPVVRPVSSLSGVQKFVKGSKVTYKIPGLRLVGNRLVLGAPVAKAGSAKSISMDPMESTMGLDVTHNFFSVNQPVQINVKPSSATADIAYITTTNSGVLDYAVVNYTNDTADTSDDWEYLALVAQGGIGKATITITTTNGKKATKVFNVKTQVLFTSMSIGEVLGTSPDDFRDVTLKSKTMYAGDEAFLCARPRPYTATYYDYPYYYYYFYRTSAVNFTSSNEKVATVSPYGDLYALSPGKATITATARDGSNKKYSFPLTVKGKNPDAISVSPKTATLAPGTTQQLAGAFTPYDYYDKRVSWSSSAAAVAKVDANGLVTAVAPGSATITGKTATGGLTDTCQVTVTYDKASNGATYRFYGIGNDNYTDPDLVLTSCRNDMNIMAEAAKDAGFALVDRNEDQTGANIVDVLRDMVNNPDIDENDVTVFFYSGHGAGSSNQYQRGALCGTDGPIVPVDMVQYFLDQVPGTVVVILDSCLSGQYITSKSLSPAKRLAAAKAFNSAWVSKLASSKATNFSSKALTTSTVKSKYKILAAAESLEYSSGSADTTGFGWFTKWAATGIGRVPNLETGSSAAGNLEADANHDKVVSLQELYAYISTNLPTDTEYAWWDPIGQQHTQVWPANDNFAVINKFGS